MSFLSHTQGVYEIGTVTDCNNQSVPNVSNTVANCTPPDYWSLDINKGFFDLVVSLKLSVLTHNESIQPYFLCFSICFSLYVIVITRARGMYGIYCTEARGRKPRGLSAICAMHPECTCYN